MDNEQQACVAFGFCQKEVKAEECPRNETWAKCGVACEPSCETMYDPSPCKASCQKPACTCADNYVRYNGQCIHWTNYPSKYASLKDYCYIDPHYLLSFRSGIPTASYRR